MAKNIIEEAGLPDNWVPIETPPVMPGHNAAPSLVGLRSDLGDFYSGSLAPALQHDANFVRTGYQVSSGATTPLMPVSASGLPQFNSASRSVVIHSGGTTPAVATGLRFRGDWTSFTVYNINDVVVFDYSTYVAIATSTNQSPDINPTFWTLLAENLSRGSVNLTTQTANVAASTLFAVVTAGLYEVSIYLVVSQAASTTSTLPDSRIIFTDRDSNATITTPLTGGLSGNTTSIFAQSTFVLNAKALTNIRYDIGQVTAYASSGGTPMQFAYRARTRFLG